MVQNINPHPAPGVMGAPYYVFSKDAILGSVPSISSEVLDLVHKRARWHFCGVEEYWIIITLFQIFYVL